MAINTNDTNLNFKFNYEIEYSHTTNIIKGDSKATISLHNHDTYEIYYLISGKVTYYIEGKVYDLLPGDILTISDKDFHRAAIDPNTSYERINIFVNKEFISKFCTEKTNLYKCFSHVDENNANNLYRPNKESIEKINSIIFKVENLIKSEKFGMDVSIYIYIVELIIYLNKIYSSEGSSISTVYEKDNVFNKIIEYINEDLSKELKLYDVADKFYISQFYLTRKFKDYTGFTFHQYVQNKRLILSQHLLNQGYSIPAIVQKCGFNDYSTFVRLFKASFGMPPRKYVKNINPL